MAGPHIFDDIIAITGHRDYPDRGALYSGLDRLHAREYYIGGARGVDTDALNYLADTQPGSIRHVIIPNRLSDQPLSVQADIRENATIIRELGNSGSDRYMIRNQYMVDRSQSLSAFTDGRTSGGTHNTIQYARLKGKPVTLHDLTEYKEPFPSSADLNEHRHWAEEIARSKTNETSIKIPFLGMLKINQNMLPSDFLAPLSLVPHSSLTSFFNDFLDFKTDTGLSWRADFPTEKE